MNLEEMKTAWREYDTKLQLAHVLSDKLIASMIRERSSSRLFKVTRQYILLLLFMCFWVFFDCAVLLGNPFDYTQTIEYAPIGIRLVCMVVLVLALLKFITDLRKIEIKQESLAVSLNAVIGIVGKYEKPGKLLGLVLSAMLFSSTVLFQLSFLPRKIESQGLWAGIADTLISIAIGVTLIGLAHVFGAFKSRQGEKFHEDLNELNELKKMSEELSRDEVG